MTATSAAAPPTIVIAAGGTAGHVVPALAIAAALQAEGARVVFAGGERAEAQLVPAAGYELEPLRVEGISRSNPLKAVRAVVRAAGAVGAARRVLARHGADAVLGGGGYVAGPVGLAALTRRIPVVLTEADSHLGLTNRLLAPRARRVCLAFPIAGREGERYLVTGRPVPPTIDDREGARAAFGIPPEATCVLIFGGSLGARSINLAAVEAFADAPYHVLHIPGARDFAALRAPGPHYVLREYVEPFGRALAAADLVVARAGGSVFELAQYGLPAVLDPLSARLRRPPDRQRALDGGGRRRHDPARRRADAAAAARGGRRAARRPRSPARDGGGLAGARAPGRRPGRSARGARGGPRAPLTAGRRRTADRLTCSGEGSTLRIAFDIVESQSNPGLPEEEEVETYSLGQRALAETLGTALLVLVGPGSVVATLVLAGDSTPAIAGSDLLGISFAFGFIITALVYALGKVSGCHINPAVTFALAATKRFPWRELPTYWARAGRRRHARRVRHLGAVRQERHRPRDGPDVLQRGHDHAGPRRSSPRASAPSC